MRPKTRSLLWLAAGITAACVFGWPADRAGAACNEPPDPAVKLASHSSSLGNIDSPFLIPGREARISGLASFTNADAVTIAYFAPVLPTTPPTLPARAITLVVVKSNCNGWKENTVCSTAGVALTYCAEAKLVVDPSSGGHALTFSVPMYAGEGPPQDAAKVKPHPTLFPTGPVRLAVAPSVTPTGDDFVPCWLVDPLHACPTVQSPELRACIDKITPPAGGSDTNQQIDTVTALPFPNDFSALCDSGPSSRPCKGNAEQLEFALDANGSMLIPMNWSAVIRPCDGSEQNCAPGQSCEGRDVMAAVRFPAKAGSTAPIQIPTTDYLALQSFNENGTTFTPGPKFIVGPQTSPTEFVVSGDTDKNFSVLRVLGCPGGKQTCDATDPDRYFNLTDRMQDGKGPVKEFKRSCDDAAGTRCKNNGDCTTTPGSTCKMQVRGEAQQFHGPCPPTPPTTLNVPGQPDGEGGSTGYLLIAVVLVGLALLWWRSGS